MSEFIDIGLAIASFIVTIITAVGNKGQKKVILKKMTNRSFNLAKGDAPLIQRDSSSYIPLTAQREESKVLP